MYPRITTLIAATLVLSSEVDAWDWWWKSPPSVPIPIESPPIEITPTIVEPLPEPLKLGVTTSTWQTATIPLGGSMWNVGVNWNNGVPNGIGDAAIFSPNPATVMGDIFPPPNPVTLGSLTLDISASGGPLLTLLFSSFSIDFHAASGNATLQILTNNGGQAVYAIIPGAGDTITLSSSLDLTQNSQGDTTDDTALHIVGMIIGPGGINYFGPFKTVLNNTVANTFTGPVNVSGGTLRLDYGGLIGVNGNLNITNTGIVNLEAPGLFNSATTNISMTGASTLLNFNGNNQSCKTLTLNGASLDTGSATLTITSGVTPISLTSAELNSDVTLTAGGTISVNNNPGFDSFISGILNPSGNLLTFNVPKVNNFDLFTPALVVPTGTIKKTGGGTWEIDGFGSYPATDVNQGTLSIRGAGVTMGLVTVDPGATLSLPESINLTASITNNGTLSLTSQQASGTYNITGNYIQGAGGNLLLNIANTHTSAIDQLHFSGTASLAGTLTVNLDTEDIVIDQDQVTFLTASTVTGTFPTISTNFPPGLSFDVGYTANSVFLVFHGNFVPSFNFLQTTGYMNFALPLFAQNDEHNLQMVRRCAFVRSRMSSPKESKLVGLLVSADKIIPPKKKEQISVSRFRNNPEGKPLSIYVAPLVSRGKFKRTHEQNGFHYRAAGALLGADYAFSQAGIGAQVGYEHLHAGVHEHWGRFDINNLFGRFYGTFTPLKHAPFFIDASMGFGGEWYDIHRNTTRGTAHAKPHGWEWDAYLGFGYDGWVRNVRFTPLLAVQSMGVHQQKYLEHGALTHNLEFNRHNTTSLRSDAGLSVGGKLVRRKITWLPEVRGYWQHEYLGHRKNIRVTTPLANLSTRTTVIGLDKNYGIIGTEQRFLFNDRWSLALDYDYQWSKHQYSNDFLVELSVYF